jgi:hypothetical protein
MSRDFSPEDSFTDPTNPENIRFYPQNLRDLFAGSGQTRIYTRKLDTTVSVAFPNQPYQVGEQLPAIVQQLHSGKPLRCSGNQRELAQKALTALKNRQPEDCRNLAKRLANDVVRAVD